MKKATSRILSLVLAICLFAAFTTNALAVSQSETALAKQQLITDWEAMLAAVQAQEEILFFALDCLDAYAADPSWTNLTRARIACTMADQALSALKWPACAVTEDQEYALMRAGVATEVLTDYYTYDFRQVSLSFRNNHIYLEEEWFKTNTTNFIKSWSSAMREYREACLYMLALETNYLYLPLVSQDDADAYWQTLAARYPLVFASHAVWNNNKYDLEDLNVNAFTRIDQASAALSQAFATHISTTGNELYDLQHGSLSKTSEVTGLPKLLPSPYWFDSENATIRYFALDDQGNQCDLTFGVIPEVVNVEIRQENVSRTAAKIWISQIEYYGTTVTNDGNTWHITTDDYTVDITWNDQTITMIWLGSCDAMLLNIYMPD